MGHAFRDAARGRGRLSLIACASGRPFAERVQQSLSDIITAAGGSSRPLLRKSKEVEFANGEIKTVIGENIRGDDVYIIQCLDDPSTHRSVNDNLMALVTALHAAAQSDAESITAVVPQFPYSRQERKKTREAITARVVARLLEDAGAARVITLDIHSEAIMGFFDRCTLEDLHASADVMRYFSAAFEINPKELVVVSPDVGGADMARYYANRLGSELAIVHKVRDYSQPGTIESMRLVGDVEGKDVLMPDDMIATGGTLLTACELLRSKGARRVFLGCALPMFNGSAIERFDAEYEKGHFEAIVGTDAVFRGPEFTEQHPWYHEVSVSPLFAHVIFNINQKLSVSQILR